MIKNEKLVTGECIYCGDVDRITKDHIPPKNIYSHPRPENLITVPSCLQCNKNASKDDEYFRNALTMRYDTYEHPDATKNWDTILRSFRRPQGKGIKKSILKTMKEVNLFTPSGIFIGKSGAYQVEVARLLVTVNRIIKGLYYHEFGMRLPNNYNVQSFLLELVKIDSEVIDLISITKGGNTQTIGEEVFTYWIRQADDEPMSTTSLLMFYGKVYFFGFTFNKNESTSSKMSNTDVLSE